VLTSKNSYISDCDWLDTNCTRILHLKKILKKVIFHKSSHKRIKNGEKWCLKWERSRKMIGRNSFIIFQLEGCIRRLWGMSAASWRRFINTSLWLFVCVSSSAFNNDHRVHYRKIDPLGLELKKKKMVMIFFLFSIKVCVQSIINVPWELLTTLINDDLWEIDVETNNLLSMRVYMCCLSGFIIF